MTKRTRTRSKWPILFVGIVLIITLSCVFFFIIIPNYAINNLDEWMQRPSQNEIPFDIENFPEEYKKREYLYWEWALIRYGFSDELEEYKISNRQLRRLLQEIRTASQKVHPIFHHPISDEDFVRLQKLQEMNNPEDSLSFIVAVDAIDEKLELSQNLEWVDEKDAWEKSPIQSIILELYIMFLDNQPKLNGEIYEEIERLTSTIDNDYWFDHFATHLDIWWPNN